jgi:uncharacterized protein
MSYPCEKCGACCRHISKVLPSLDRGDGVCLHLSEDNLCEIYEERPLICNIDEIHNRLFPGVEIEQFYALTHKYCEALRRGRW